MTRFNFNESEDERFMQVALELASGGEGKVEPNPMVGALVVRDGEKVGVGFHRYFGGCHAEVEAISDAVKKFGNDITVGATCYVTLEPCSHYGKTPPCTEAILKAGIKRVVIAMRDPNPVVNGRGIEILQSNGVEVTEGVLESQARYLNAPYITLIEKKRPWIIAKWAMTLDGRLATSTGQSKWISNEASRLIVQKLRQRVDAIMIGSNTAKIDNPNLTVRGVQAMNLSASSESANLEADSFSYSVENSFKQRCKPLRIVLDSKAELAIDSNLVRTAGEVPLLVVVSADAELCRVNNLLAAGCEILELPMQVSNSEIEKLNDSSNLSNEIKKIYGDRLEFVLEYLAQRKLTNVLIEGGQKLFGTLFDARLIDEIYVFIAMKLVGGERAIPVIGGMGIAEMECACRLDNPKINLIDDDVQIHGRLNWRS
jgi:diaminohydroxyphosphoribosylaminopyrimidine deaminase/5-amino-6-(5-phosphoribosylamino)uracil reductase